MRREVAMARELQAANGGIGHGTRQSKVKLACEGRDACSQLWRQVTPECQEAPKTFGDHAPDVGLILLLVQMRAA